MSNPLFESMGNTQGGPAELMQRFLQFRSGYQGDARSQIQNMLNSGRITQEQYNRAVQIANQMMRYMK